MTKRNPTKPTILIVDDDEAVRPAFALALSGAGYRVLEAGDGLEALEVTRRENPALILLDLDMPGVNGWQTLERLRKNGFNQSVIILTGHTMVEDRVKGLTAGADDYLGKPCDLRELIARVHTVLRRSQPAVSGPTVIHLGPTTVDLKNRTAARAGQAVGLTRTEYAILEVFARHPGELVTRAAMLENVWGYSGEANTRTVDTHIWRLRQKLDDSATDPQWIQTVSAGDGYRMMGDMAGA
ncbi:MAG TPA: response regulator transcription factor [Lacunisphaera sp.]|jgi:two-component system response regulator MprA